MKQIKKNVSSREAGVNGFKVSAMADLSAFAHAGGFVLSLIPVSVIVETDTGKYTYDLKRIEDPL